MRLEKSSYNGNNHSFACYIIIRAYSQIASQPAIICLKLTIKTLEQRDEISSKLTIKTLKQPHCRRFDVFIANFEHISHLCSSISIVNFKQVNAGWVPQLVFSNIKKKQEYFSNSVKCFEAVNDTFRLKSTSNFDELKGPARNKCP